MTHTNNLFATQARSTVREVPSSLRKQAIFA